MSEVHKIVHPDIICRKQIPGDLLSRAWHALPWGMLVVSAQGCITFYNQTYAQLRGLAPGALLGHPIDRLDRRHRLQELLRTGTMPPERAVPNEQRKNREAIFPVWDESRNLTGAVVLVIPRVAGPWFSREASSQLMRL